MALFIPRQHITAIETLAYEVYRFSLLSDFPPSTHPTSFSSSNPLPRWNWSSSGFNQLEDKGERGEEMFW